MKPATAETPGERGRVAPPTRRAVCRLLLPLPLAMGAVHRAGAQVPSRIISLIPAVTEMLFAIGAGPQVIAVSSFDAFPPEATKLPRVGALIDPDLERILSLRPDLVVVYGTQDELRRQLDRAGIPQFVYRHARLADITDTMRALGRRVGRTEEGVRAASALEGALQAVRERVSGRRRPRTLLVFGREPGTLRSIFASGGFGFLHDMLEAAGGENVFADVPRESVQATSELVLARRPEVILEVKGGSPQDPARTQKDVDAWGRLAAVPAVRAKRVHIITDDRVIVPGPRAAQGTELMARALHPDAFA